MSLSRRGLLKNSSAVALGFAGLRALAGPAAVAAAGESATRPSGGATEAKGGTEPLLDLPAGFSCHAVSRFGDEMDDGLRTPGMADGMAAFPGPDG